MKPWSNLAKVVYARTYSRSDHGTRERWEDTVRRVIIGNVRNHHVPMEEIQHLTKFMLERKATPAGRGLWFSGAPSHNTIGGFALNNCFATTADDWYNFAMAQELLMWGGGVGLSVQHKHVSKLPHVRTGVRITHKFSRDADFIVPDSREGWCELTRRVLEAYFLLGKSFTYSTICIRSEGEPIQGFGGQASGPRPLIDFVDTLSNILIAREGKHIRPIDAGDIICSIGHMVVSGLVRRSAILLLGDAWDAEYLRAKRWDLGPVPAVRARANYSVACSSVEDLHPAFWETFHAGEAFGIVNIKSIQKFGRMGEMRPDTAYLTNPCVTGDTLLATPEGDRPIEDCVDTTTTIWNGEQWSDVVPRITGTDEEIFRVTLSDGRYLDSTSYHWWCCRDYLVQTQNLEIGTYIRNFPIPGLELDLEEDISIVSVESRGVADKVYCFHEPLINQGCFNNIVTGNCGEATLEGGPGQAAEPCNLLELYMPNFDSADEFIHAARLMHRWGKRVCQESYRLYPNIERIIRRNQRIGIGITGCLQAPHLFNAETLNRAYLAIQESDAQYSAELNCPRSIRTTVCKPAGTSSLLGDCTPGIHPAFSRYYIRRVRFAANDSLIPILREAGHHMEPEKLLDGRLNHGTLVVDFYMQTPPGTPCADDDWDTWKQLDTVKFAQRYWADQSVSVSVYYRREDIPRLKEWLQSNLDEIKTISFLCHNDHGFEQAPIEAISAEQYERFSSQIKPLGDLDNIADGHIVSLECDGGACPAK